MNTEKFINKLVREISYRTDQGYPDFSKEEHIQVMAEILDEWNLSEIKSEIINTLISEAPDDDGENLDKEFNSPTLNKIVKYKDEDGNEKESLVGNLMRKGEDHPGRQSAEQYLPDEGTPERDVLNKELGSEEDGETESPDEEGEETEGGEGEDGMAGQEKMGTSVDPDSAAGQDYLDSLPDGDPAKKQLKKKLGLDEGIITEAAMATSEFITSSKVDWKSFIRMIKNGDKFELHGSTDKIEIDKSFLNATGVDGETTIKDLGDNPSQEQLDNFFRNDAGRYQKVILSKDGKPYKLNDLSKETWTGQGGSGGSKSPSADQYEWGIAVEYNKKQGMSREEALKAADVDEKEYSKYETILTEVCSKIVEKAPSMGSRLRQTGADKVPPASVWPSREGTPKTDILGNTNWRISLKKRGGSQLASGNREDASGIFKAGLEFYQTHDNHVAEKYLQDILNGIESDFKKYNTANSVTVVRNDAQDAYIEYRAPKIRTQDPNISQKDAEYHAKAEAKLVGIGNERGKYESWLIDGVEIFDEKQIMTWFDGYWRNKGTKELQEEAKNIVETAIDHKRLTTNMEKAFKDDEFRKWCIYEASSGNYKFSGNSNINSSDDPIANKIMVFDESGKFEIDDITSSWAKKYSSNVKSVVAFKSSGRSKWSAWRMIQESDGQGQPTFFNDMYDIITEERENLTVYINEAIEDYNELLTEIDFKSLARKAKKFAKRLMDKITDKIKRFYENIIKRAMNKLKDWARAGIKKFLEYLGIEIDGRAQVDVTF